MIRKLTVDGYLIKDPEIKRTNAGTDMATFTMSSWIFSDGKDANGRNNSQLIEVTGFLPMVIKLIQNQQLKKGSYIVITGDLKPINIYTGADGAAHAVYKMNMESFTFMSDGRPTNTNGNQQAQPQQQYAQQPVQQPQYAQAQPQQQYVQQPQYAQAPPQQQYAQQPVQQPVQQPQYAQAQPQQQYAQPVPAMENPSGITPETASQMAMYCAQNPNLANAVAGQTDDLPF